MKFDAPSVPGPSRTLSRTLSAEAIERGMRVSVVEGLAFALMVGFGELYFLADAVRLSATPFQQGLVVILPLFVGSLGPLLSLRVLSRLATRKPLVVAASLAQALTLAALAVCDALAVSTPGTLIACASAYQLFGQSVGTAWASWFGDLVPEGERGPYFARRNRGIYLLTSVGVLLGGLFLHLLEPASAALSDARGGTGFAWIFGLAAAFRLISTALHVRTPEPSFQRPYSRLRIARFLATRRGIDVRRVLLTCAGLYLTVYVASPYFAPFMLDELGFDYLEYTAASLVVVLLKVLLLPVWGRRIERSGARPVLLLATVCAALVPLIWLWADGLAWVLVAQAFSGLSWAGFELSLFCLLQERGVRGARPSIFALQTVLNGTAQLLGGLAGALLVGSAGVELRTLFAISLVGRLVFAGALPRLIRAPVESVARGRRALHLRVVGLRPSGGLAVRPVPRARKSD